MKVDFFFAWTKNKDKRNEYTKTIGANFKLPFLFKWLKFFKKKS